MPEKINRGFRRMDPERQRELARKGGKSAHAKGTAHEWTSLEARDAGRKGAAARIANYKARQTEASV